MKRNRIFGAVVFAMLMLALALPARAVLSVGDTPQLSFRSMDGKNVDLKNLKGKLVLIDFWASWCGPCMQEAPHVVETNKKYQDKGLVLIGINLDEDRSAAQAVVKSQNFAWPQYFDGRGWKNKYAGEWGVDSIPRTFLVDPTGKVAWTGHPAMMDAAIENAFKKTPPVLVDPDVAAKASETLDQVDASIKTGDNAGAIKLFAMLPADARKDPKIDARAKSDEEKLKTAAEAMLAEVEPLVQQKQYTAATAKLKDLAAALGDSPAGAMAKQRLSQINAMPEAQAQIAAADKAAKATQELGVAQDLQSQKKDDQAYARFKEIVRQYPGTPAATTAADAVKTYEQDPAFVKRANEAAAGSKAGGMLSLARSYRSAHRRDKAQAKFQEVIDQFPGTSFAETAAKEIAVMNQ